MTDLNLTVIPLPSGVSVDDDIDLRGEVCPYTFVKSKLALEDMEVGQVLSIRLDHLPAVDNCPRSFRNEGQEIVGVEQVDDTDWLVTVRKVRE
ncbi:MAG: sulfurtransferase TusA family protein [Dehalococcoidia bacterium]|nr:sulfurtransferase TusA family protein [Dehalococcoidia bacterium]